MITVEVFAPMLNKSYDFKLDEDVKINILLEEILEMLCRKEKKEMTCKFSDFCLACVDNGVILNNSAFLNDYKIKNGSRLILI